MAKKTNKEKKTKLKIQDASPSKSTKVKSTKAKTGASKSGGSKKSSKPAKSTNPASQKKGGEAYEKRLARVKRNYNRAAVETPQSKKKRQEQQRIDKLQKQLAKRVKAANEIVTEYGDYEHLQPIFADARRTLPPTRKKADELFTTDIKSEKAIMRELARIDIFEAQVRGRQDDYYEDAVTGKSTRRPLTQEQMDKVTEMRRNFYKGAFGGQWMKKNDDHETYDKSRIVKEFAEEAFSIYSHLTESTSEDYIKMLWSKKMGKSQYESESLIIQIYDMVSMGYSRKSIEDFLEGVKTQLQADYTKFQFDNPNDYEKIPR